MDNGQTIQNTISARSVPIPDLTPQNKKSGQDADKNEEEKEKSYPVLLDNLRDKFMQYSETSSRCRFQIKPQGKGEQFTRFHYAPKIPFLSKPEKQQIYRKQFVSEVGRIPEPKPLYLIADHLHHDQLDALGDRSEPTITKQELSQFYSRRQAVLQHKKHKLIQRWAQSHLTAQQVDQVSEVIDKAIGYIQIEQDSVTSRLMRLGPDDRYDGADTADRPKPAATMTVPDTQSSHKEEGGRDLYEESGEKFIASTMRQDDFEVFIRHTSYLNKISRPALKLIQQIKWLPAQQKYEIWGLARQMMKKQKDDILQERFNLCFQVTSTIKHRLMEMGGFEDKGIQAITQKYVYHLQEPEFLQSKEKMLNSYKFEHTKLSQLFASSTELKHFLKGLALEFQLNFSQIDLDKGQQFTYQMQTLFPSEFEKQSAAMTFDFEDSGFNKDQLIIERLSRNLGLTKDQLLEEMGRYSTISRKQSILGALNVGKTGATDQSLKDLTENEFNKDQFIKYNLIRKLKTIEFFSLNESETRVRKADWLNFVCWNTNISIQVQKQNQLISGNGNSIDHLLRAAFEFVDVNDSASVNKVLEDAVTTHIQKITEVQKKIAQGFPAYKPAQDSLHDNKTDSVIASLTVATNPVVARQQQKDNETKMFAQQNSFQKKFDNILNVDPLPINLTKCYYSLRLIKTRKFKIQLLHVMNYFRAIQRILAHDVREFMSREKAMGDQKDLIDPHFGKNSKGVSITKLQGPAGPGDIFNQNVERELDKHQKKSKKDRIDTITLKAYKYNNSYDPIVISTCPVVPKHHRTFGKPTIYESVSAETQRLMSQSNFKQAKQALSNRDRIVVDFEIQSIHILNEYGMKIVYSEAMHDLAELEEEMIKIGSFFINNYEYVIAVNDILEDQNASRPSSLIDRAEIACDLYKFELQFQFSKVRLVEQIMKAYEHITDPLEHVRTLQMVVDIMAQRPRINMQSNNYTESYISETNTINLKTELFADFVSMQKQVELFHNQESQKFVELKVRRMQEAQADFWKIKKELEKKLLIGSDEALEEMNDTGDVDGQIREEMRAKNDKAQEKQDKIKEIASRHITDFANKECIDFAQVLGMPEISMETLYNRFDQKEPIVIDSIRESAFFVKMVEGYPDKISQNPSIGSDLGYPVEDGLTDFFENIEILPRFNAAIHQIMAQMEKDTLPENSFALSCLEYQTLKEIRIQLLKTRKAFEDRIAPEDLKGQHYFEEDFYFGNSDKLYSTMRHMHYEMSKENLSKISNPMVAAHLELSSVENYNFPRLRSKDVIDQLIAKKVPEKLINDQFTKEATVMAKTIIARPLVKLSNPDENPFEKVEKKEVKIPSLMLMSCNLLETLRLREEIILRMHETNILSEIYMNQCDLATKHNKISTPDIIPFETNQILSKDFVNLMDLNDGINLNFDNRMPFMEFNPLLRVNLDFTSESCIKAFFTSLGVEELRVILHCQIMQQHLLIVAVRQNDVLIDKPMKGLKELELIAESIATPNSSIDVDSIISNQNDGLSNSANKVEKSRIQQQIVQGLTDCFYMVLSKKTRDRQVYAKKFQQVVSQLRNALPTPKPETQLRILRSFRISLCHQYCQNIIQVVHQDSLKIQVIEACNNLRMRALLLPNKSQIFKLGRGEFQENLSFEAFHFLQNSEGISAKGLMNVASILAGQGVCNIANTMFYIPTSEEICICDRKVLSADELDKTQKEIMHAAVCFLGLDNQIKMMCKRPTKVDVYDEVYKLEKTSKYGVRKTWFKEANCYSDKEPYSLLIYLSNILNIFDLEYTMMRNHARGAQCYELEQISQSGTCFWNQFERQVTKIEQFFLEHAQQNEKNIENSTSFKIVERIHMKKKAWIDLSEDIQAVVDQMQKLNGWLKQLPIDRRQISYINDMLTLQHQSRYLCMLNGIENMIEYYIEKGSDEYFAKLMETRSILTRQNLNEISLLRSNGNFISQGSVNPDSIDINSRIQNEFAQFQTQQQFVVDERALIPRQVIVLQKLFGYQNQKTQRDTSSGYSSLIHSAFYNMEDEQRGLLTSTFETNEETIKDYLACKGLESAPGDSTVIAKGKDHMSEMLLATVEILSFKVEVAHLERVLMTWNIGGQKLPKDTKEFKILQRQNRTNNMLTILSERDTLNAQYLSKIQRKAPANPDSKAERNNEILSPRRLSIVASNLLSVPQQPKIKKILPYMNRVNQLRAESIVLKQMLEVNLLKIGIDTVDREHAALIACFDAVANDNQIQAFVNPQQQFASVLYPTVDKIPHLDVVAKVGFLQGFLTRLRNRCTEVETLTSGPGIVFSVSFIDLNLKQIKDFNECVGVLAKQLIKYSEEELRGRCETQNLREHQYHHLVYIKEMEVNYYRAKCEQFLTNIDSIINLKMTNQGNQMIYELDVTSRELRTLKDHYYLMERNLREEIRSEFNKAILDKDQKLHQKKLDFKAFRDDLSKQKREEVEKEISNLDQRVKQITNQHHQPSEVKKSSHTDHVHGGKQKPQSVDNYEYIQEITLLTQTIRKQQILNSMRRVVQSEKSFQEMAAQKEKLTQNKSLWDQLAECEKREQITQQELILTKTNLGHYERLIEKLYTQLEHLNNQKLRLEEYKKNKAKRITELESKMKDLEILENIDLTKILEELRNRDKKIAHLDKIEGQFNERIDSSEEYYQNQMKELQNQIQVERRAKLVAFEKLESMRIEMKSLEGKDNVKNDLWKSKCKELYDICRDLEQENEKLKNGLVDVQVQMKLQAEKNERLMNQTSSQFTDNQSVPLSRENIILQRNNLIKPFTATGTSRRERIFSSNNAGTSPQQNRRNENQLRSLNNLQELQTVASSLPGFATSRVQKPVLFDVVSKKQLKTQTSKVGGQKIKSQLISGLNASSDGHYLKSQRRDLQVGGTGFGLNYQNLKKTIGSDI